MSLTAVKERIIRICRTHGDMLLLLAALLVLAAGLFLPKGRKVIAGVTASPLKFTQWWQYELEPGTLESLAAEFEALHPNIKIVLDTRPYREIRDLLLEPVEAVPELPPAGDILALDTRWLPALSRQGALEFPLGEGPLITYIYPLFYNIDLLKAAGFSRPPKNRSEFLDMAGKAAGGGAFGLGVAGESPGFLWEDVCPWLYAGGNAPAEQGEPWGDGKAAAESFAFLQTLREERIIAPASFSWDEGQKLEAFIAGRLVFMIAPVQNIKLLEKRMGPGAFGITGIPAPDAYAGKPVLTASGWNLGVSGTCAFKEEAAAFAAFLAEKSAFLAEKAGAVPGAVNALNGAPAPPAGESPLYQKARDLCAAADLVEEAPDLAGNLRLEDVFSGKR